MGVREVVVPDVGNALGNRTATMSVCRIFLRESNFLSNSHENLWMYRLET